jgi:hypothetical protein
MAVGSPRCSINECMELRGGPRRRLRRRTNSTRRQDCGGKQTLQIAATQANNMTRARKRLHISPV